jgi:hypothetical protein
MSVNEIKRGVNVRHDDSDYVPKRIRWSGKVGLCWEKPMNIIERIKALAKGEAPDTLVWLDRSTADSDQTEIGSIGGLVALAESHERLKEIVDALEWIGREGGSIAFNENDIAAGILSTGRTFEGCSVTFNQTWLKEVIAEAEKLTQKQ